MLFLFVMDIDHRAANFTLCHGWWLLIIHAHIGAEAHVGQVSL